MKKREMYLIPTLLLLAALLLAACAGEMTAAAAENDLPAVEAINETAALAVETDQQEMTGAAGILQDEPPAAKEAPGNGAGPGQHAPLILEGELSQAEIDALTYMREEEKLARDVYLTMADLWGAPIFTNIAGSEQTHMDAVANLLQAYDLQDPAAGKALGEFSNSDLQALYDQLIARGQISQEEALRVGAAIEEIDILDLQEDLGQIENAALTQVFESLLAGSSNHLRAFASNLERQTGSAYTPQYMSQEAYTALLGANTDRGYGSGRRDGRGGQTPGAGTGGGPGGRGQGPGDGRGPNS